MKLWVVECKYRGDYWCVCSSNNFRSCSENYRTAHKLKKEIMIERKSSMTYGPWWKRNQKNKFRVREYRRVEK